MATCVPAIRPLYLKLFYLPGAEHYGGSSRQKKSYQKHTSPNDTPRRRWGPDTELMSLDTCWNTTTLRGTDGDGEGLVNQDVGKIRQTVEKDVRYDSQRDSPDFGEEGQTRSGQKGW